MVVDKSELVLYLSGGSGNTNPNLSIGGGISTTALNANTGNIPILENLFPNTTAVQSLAGKVRNRCIYLKNNSATSTARFIYAWLSQITPSNDIVKIYVRPGQAANVIEPSLTDEALDPYTDVVWLRLVSYDQAVNNPLPNLGPGQYTGIWLQDFVPAQTPSYANTFTEFTFIAQNY